MSTGSLIGIMIALVIGAIAATTFKHAMDNVSVALDRGAAVMQR